jgi:LmbE family N-acetylglucosaminyl deacetylase
MIGLDDRILVIAPHADDELIGLGGSLLKWKSFGSKTLITLVACSDIYMHHKKKVVKGSTRLQEFAEICEEISTEDHINLAMKDSELDTHPLSQLVSQLDKIIEDFRPSVIIFPEPSYHQDHQYVNRACTASLRPTKENRPRLILTYEIPTSTWSGSAPSFIPNYYVDISNFIERKISLFNEVYISQFTRESRQKLASQGILDHAKYRGMECGKSHAESFRLLQFID